MSSADDIISTYKNYARAFDEDRARNLFEKSWLDRFLALLPTDGTVLDLGCGAGEPIARYFLQSGRRVTGVDSSPAMIDLCETRFPDSAWHVADMRRLDLDARFDGLIAWDSFFHLNHEDQRGMFPLFARHAGEGGALMFTSGHLHGEEIGRLRDQPLYHASLDTDAYRALLDANGFDVVAHVEQDPNCDFHTVWLAQRR